MLKCLFFICKKIKCKRDLDARFVEKINEWTASFIHSPVRLSLFSVSERARSNSWRVCCKVGWKYLGNFGTREVQVYVLFRKTLLSIFDFVENIIFVRMFSDTTFLKIKFFKFIVLNPKQTIY